MKIITAPNPILKTKCQEVSFPLTEEDKKLLDNMFEYVKQHSKDAVGLSAPQVGVAKRMFVIYRTNSNGTVTQFKMVNPIVIPCKKQQHYYVLGGEGCLSEPNIKVSVKRYRNVLLCGFDTIRNKKIQITLTDFDAAIAQHEYDHLEGKLLEDYLK